MIWAIITLISIIGGVLFIRTERRYRALQRKLEERRETVTWAHPINPVNVEFSGDPGVIAEALRKAFRRAADRAAS